jgi:hypothetical protein
VNEKIREAFLANWIQFTYDHLVLHIENWETANQALSNNQSYTNNQEYTNNQMYTNNNLNI